MTATVSTLVVRKTCSSCGKVFSSLDWDNPHQAWIDHVKEHHG